MFNGYGALMLGLITAQMSLGFMDGESVEWLIQAVMLNFYSIFALVVTFFVIWFTIDIGAMRHALVKHERNEIQEGGHPMYMIVPILLMIGGVFLFLYITGEGNILKGSGSSSIFYTMVMTLILMGLFFVAKKVMPLKTVTQESLKGMRSMIGITLILFFAFAIGQVTSDMHTGIYLASYVNAVLSPAWLAAAVFLLAAVQAGGPLVLWCRSLFRWLLLWMPISLWSWVLLSPAGSLVITVHLFQTLRSSLQWQQDVTMSSM
jgi:Na+/H+ antiporter NhaC